jgi:predicted amidophosphoribosyltransferase
MPLSTQQTCRECRYDCPRGRAICPACGTPLPIPMRVIALFSASAVLSLAVAMFFHV